MSPVDFLFPQRFVVVVITVVVLIYSASLVPKTTLQNRYFIGEVTETIEKVRNLHKGMVLLFKSAHMRFAHASLRYGALFVFFPPAALPLGLLSSETGIATAGTAQEPRGHCFPEEIFI